MKPEECIEGEDEFVMDEVTGARSKKPVLSALNKKQLSKYEMDDLFGDF